MDNVNRAKLEEKKEEIKTKKIKKKASEICGVSNVTFIIPTLSVYNKVESICKINYSIEMVIIPQEYNVNTLLKILDFHCDDLMVWPFFFGSNLWISFNICDVNSFLLYICNQQLSSLTLIRQYDSKVFDFEYGEDSYELRTMVL